MNNRFKDCTIIIPARMNSKGLPYKNRRLVPVVINTIKELENSIIVSTDDPHIIKYVENLNRKNITVENRPIHLAEDNTAMKDVILNITNSYSLKGDVIVLYPTYPERTVQDILRIYEFYKKNKLKSLLCSKKIKTHPYMCLKKIKEIFGKPIFDHKLYRRQDYPECFELSHFTVIANCKEINNLNSQMYNDQTGYYRIDDKIDIDYEEDFKNYESEVIIEKN